jgi:uncharacterized RDD family membrane protein YckC
MSEEVNVIVENKKLDYASIGNRIIAAILDGIILIFINFIVGMVLTITINQSSSTSDESLNSLNNLINILISYGYTAYLMSSESQATLGQMAMGIKVTDENGNRITFVAATIRYFMSLVSGIILAIGYLMALFNDKKQTLHDLVAKTVVLKK